MRSKGRGKAVSAVWKAVTRHKGSFFTSALLDLLFLAVAGIFNSLIVKKLTGLMYVIGGMLSRASVGLTGQQSFVGLIGEAGAWGYVSQLAALFIIWLGGLYFLYCFFQGLCWRLAYIMIGKPYDLLHFAKRFFRINVPWYLLFILINSVLFVVAYFSAADGQDVSLSILWYIPHFVLLYLALISYGMPEKGVKAAIVSAWNWRPLLSYLAILLLFTLVHFLLIGAGYLGRAVTIMAGLLLFVPAFSAVRLYWLQKQNIFKG